jgi:hypothetical protein
MVALATLQGSRPVVYDGVRPDLCPALEQIILGRMQRARGRKVGSINVGGWKSGEDFFAWPDEAVQTLRETIVGMIGARSPVGWTMVNRAGSYHPRHQHPIATLTGIFYVTAGSPEAVTPTVFECEDGDLEVDPHPGRLALFPGTLWHSLPSYPGNLPRITVAFDVRR